MTTPKTIVIDGTEYIKKSEAVDESLEPLRIIMNDDRGLCIVGNVDLSGSAVDKFVTIKNARVIIRWGTTAHLAELADKGPTENTRLGHGYDHTMPLSKISLVLECNINKWMGK